MAGHIILKHLLERNLYIHLFSDTLLSLYVPNAAASSLLLALENILQLINCAHNNKVVVSLRYTSKPMPRLFYFFKNI